MKKQHLEALTEVKDGKMTAIGSTEDRDRVGDVLKVGDWDLGKFKKNPVLQAGHDYRPQFTIGVAKNIRVEGKKLIFEPRFHTLTRLASEIKAMFEEGILKAWSVGFIPAQEDGEKNELLEVSAVAVPANPYALSIIKSMENMEEEKEKDVSDKIAKWVQEKGGCCGGSESTTEALPKKDDTENEEKEKDKKIDKEEKAKKSPACRKDDESKKECVSRKIPEIMNEDPDMEQNQAVAIANSMCEKKCSDKDKKEKIVERWNKSLSTVFNKAFDIAGTPSKPSTSAYELYTKYLGCKVKNIYVNDFIIPSPLLGTYLAGFKELLGKYKLIDERNFHWYGGESPLVYEVIQLNSKESDDFLIEGTRFYESNEQDMKFIVKFCPTWFGMSVSIIGKTADKKWSKEFLADVHKWTDKNNKLKGEIFGLSGEFLSKTKDTWDDLILPKGVSDPIRKGVKRLKDKGKDAKSRGLLYVGVPGTGKTKSGKVIMNDLEDATFIWVSSRDFKKVDPTTAMVLGFDLARKLAPSVLFLEDIDTWLKDYAIDLLKTEMDGIKENKGMITILTSNSPEKLPDALIDRPGRFHDVLEFLPPNKELRKEMIKKWAGNVDKKKLDRIISETNGYSGAHMKELVDFAQMIVEDDNINIGDALLKSLDKLKKQRDLVKRIREGAEGDNSESSGSDDRLADMKSVEIKEGRVISRKNRTTIKSAIEAQNKSVAALEELLELSESSGEDKRDLTPEKAKGSGIVKSREPKKVDKFSSMEVEEIVLRTLQKIAKNSNFALSKLKKDRK